MKRLGIALTIILALATAGCTGSSQVSGNDGDPGIVNPVAPDGNGDFPFGNDDWDDGDGVTEGDDDDDDGDDTDRDNDGGASNKGAGDVSRPIEFETGADLGKAMVGEEFETRISAQGGSGDLSWSVAGLPAGLTSRVHNSYRLLISGTPEAIGRYEFTVTLTDNEDPAMSAERTFSLLVKDVIAFNIRKQDEQDLNTWNIVPDEDGDGAIAIELKPNTIYRIDAIGGIGAATWSISDDKLELFECYDEGENRVYHMTATDMCMTPDGVFSRRYLQLKQDVVLTEDTAVQNVIVRLADEDGDTASVTFSQVDMIHDPCQVPITITATEDDVDGKPAVIFKAEGGIAPYTWSTSYYTEMERFGGEVLKGYTVKTSNQYSEAFEHFGANFRINELEDGTLEAILLSTNANPSAYKSYKLLLTAVVRDSCEERERTHLSHIIVHNEHRRPMDTLDKLKVRIDSTDLDDIDDNTHLDVHIFVDGELVAKVNYSVACLDSPTYKRVYAAQDSLERSNLSNYTIDEIDEIKLRFHHGINSDDDSWYPMDMDIRTIKFYTDDWYAIYDDGANGNRFNENICGGAGRQKTCHYGIFDDLDNYPEVWLPMEEGILDEFEAFEKEWEKETGKKWDEDGYCL